LNKGWMPWETVAMRVRFGAKHEGATDHVMCRGGAFTSSPIGGLFSQAHLVR